MFSSIHNILLIRTPYSLCPYPVLPSSVTSTSYVANKMSHLLFNQRKISADQQHKLTDDQGHRHHPEADGRHSIVARRHRWLHCFRGSSYRTQRTLRYRIINKTYIIQHRSMNTKKHLNFIAFNFGLCKTLLTSGYTWTWLFLTYSTLFWLTLTRCQLMGRVYMT